MGKPEWTLGVCYRQVLSIPCFPKKFRPFQAFQRRPVPSRLSREVLFSSGVSQKFCPVSVRLFKDVLFKNGLPLSGFSKMSCLFQAFQRCPASFRLFKDVLPLSGFSKMSCLFQAFQKCPASFRLFKDVLPLSGFSKMSCLFQAFQGSPVPSRLSKIVMSPMLFKVVLSCPF